MAVINKALKSGTQIGEGDTTQGVDQPPGSFYLTERQKRVLDQNDLEGLADCLHDEDWQELVRLAENLSDEEGDLEETDIGTNDPDPLENGAEADAGDVDERGGYLKFIRPGHNLPPVPTPAQRPLHLASPTLTVGADTNNSLPSTSQLSPTPQWEYGGHRPTKAEVFATVRPGREYMYCNRVRNIPAADHPGGAGVNLPGIPIPAEASDRARRAERRTNRQV